MDEQLVMQAINDIEKKFPVNKWKVNGIDFWPIFRIITSFALIKAKSDNANVEAIKIEKSPISIPNISQAFDEQEADILFFSDSQYRVQLNSIWYNRLSDPLYEISTKMGFKAINLDFSYQNASKIPVIENTYSIQNQLIAAQGIKTIENLDIQLSEIENVRKILLKLTDDEKNIPDIPNIKWMATQVLHWKSIFKEIIVKKKIKCLFIVNYYQIISQALILAARELHITTVDIQHGNQRDLFYHKWINVPKGSYNTLPDYFWSWTKEHAKPIEEWTNETKLHQVVVGGNPWLEIWKDDKYLLTRYYENIINKYLNKLHINILITLQPLYGLVNWGHNIPDWVIDAIKESPNNWKFHIRYHQQMLYKFKNERDICEKQLANLIVSGKVETKKATILPLPALLKNIDIHITPFSTCVIEAKEFNVPSITLHPRSKLYFQKEIESGWVTEAETNAGIIQAIKALIKAKEIKINKIITNENERVFDKAIKNIIKSSEVPDYSKFVSKKETLFSIYFMDETYEEIINKYNELDSFKATLYVSDAYQELKDERNKIKFTIIALEKALLNQEILDANDIYKIIYRLIDEQYFEVYSENIMSLFNQRKSLLGEVLWKLYTDQQYEIIIKLCKFIKEQTLDSLYYGGRALLQQQELSKSLAKLNSYIKLYNGDNDFNITYTESFLISANFYLGQINLELCNYAQALKNFEDCIALSEGKHQRASEYLETIKSKLR